MANFNKVILAGNLTRDPEMRYTPKGMAIASFGMAINRTHTSETGEKKEEATFVDVTAFGRTAEVISQYLKKGRPILIEGRLKYDTWDDKQTGQKRSKLAVVADGFQFLDSGRQGEGVPAPEGALPGPVAGSSPTPRASAPAPAPAHVPPPPDDVPPMEGDDVPF